MDRSFKVGDWVEIHCLERHTGHKDLQGKIAQVLDLGTGYSTKVKVFNPPYDSNTPIIRWDNYPIAWDCLRKKYSPNEEKWLKILENE